MVGSPPRNRRTQTHPAAREQGSSNHTNSLSVSRYAPASKPELSKKSSPFFHPLTQNFSQSLLAAFYSIVVKTSIPNPPQTPLKSAFQAKKSPMCSNKVIGPPIPASPGFLSVFICVHLWLILLRNPHA
jgi:hypothetical protein